MADRVEAGSRYRPGHPPGPPAQELLGRRAGVCHHASGMTVQEHEALGIIAGKGAYPRVLAESARRQGVSRLVAVAFKRETDPVIDRLVDEVAWLPVGQLEAMLNTFQRSGVKQVVMAGQITPTHLFRVRPDRMMRELLSNLKERNAHTIFGAVADALAAVGIELKPATLFMESAMAEAGNLTRRGPTDLERADIALGVQVARATSGLEIGQTVVIKRGTILAVEAFEGTDATIRRAGKLGGPGAVVVKVAKAGHDMRFDVPVIGLRTMKTLKRAGAAVLAVLANRTILLDREAVVEQADRQGCCIVAMSPDGHDDNPGTGA